MSTKTEVVYPSISSYSGSSQLNLGPYNVPTVGRLLRAEVRGQFNYQGANYDASSVLANLALWAVQWVPAGDSPSDVVTTADGPQFLIREQMGTEDILTSWAPSTDVSALLLSYGLRSFWAGQLHIGESIDLYMSLRAPTSVTLANFNLFASLRFWWS